MSKLATLKQVLNTLGNIVVDEKLQMQPKDIKSEPVVASSYDTVSVQSQGTQSDQVVEESKGSIDINIIDGDFDSAIEEAKLRKLINKDISSLAIKKQFEAALVELNKYGLLEPNGETPSYGEKKKKPWPPKPPDWLSCKRCGGPFGVCIFGGCFMGIIWKFPI